MNFGILRGLASILEKRKVTFSCFAATATSTSTSTPTAIIIVSLPQSTRGQARAASEAVATLLPRLPGVNVGILLVDVRDHCVNHTSNFSRKEKSEVLADLLQRLRCWILT